MYDNGSHMRGFSRVVEYVVDYDAMTADIAWEYPGTIAEDDWFDFSLGDADRQPNGNTLVTATSLLEEDSQSRIFEVTAEGQKVWEVTMREAGGEPAAAYAAERIPVLVEQLD